MPDIHAVTEMMIKQGSHLDEKQIRSTLMLILEQPAADQETLLGALGLDGAEINLSERFKQRTRRFEQAL